MIDQKRLDEIRANLDHWWYLCESDANYLLSAVGELQVENGQLRASRDSWHMNVKHMETEISALQERVRGLEAALGSTEELSRLYNELLYCVGNKYEGETRHQTALRYLKNAEVITNVAVSALGREGEKG